MSHADTYERAQKLVTKISKGLREWETNADVTATNQASISVELQTLNRQINQYKKQIDVSYKMADEHQILQNRFNAAKKFYQDQSDAARKNELFQRSDGTRVNAQDISNSTRNRNSAHPNNDSFYERSEIEIDGFIDQGLAALDNLKFQRASLKNSHKNVLDSRNTLGLSDRVIRFINRRNAQDKLIMFAGMIFTLIAVYYILKYFS
ncbi:hypothetical protein BB561_006568 [Smittium simulii]|uniref:Protein transport protein BOS1 n=2 Tax=Smittium simulii TaxID=133385 RepID=A0A2T9Y345_9FUNG|nr:hypothetical protein BB561_006568 [Smittium simulii]